MNIHEAAKSGKPFTHSDMIGAWLIVDGQMIHRDNASDFLDMAFIRRECIPPLSVRLGRTEDCIGWTFPTFSAMIGK